jgi:multiple sugar transport system permease protein
MYLVLALFFLWTVIPIYIVVTNSLKPTLQIKEIPPVFLFQPTLTHYSKVLGDGEFGGYFINSLIIASVTTVISVLGGALGAYGLTLARSRWASRTSNLMLLGKLVPAIAILIPFYTILKLVSLNGTYVGPILAHCSVNLTFVVWLMMSFMSDIPKELYESSFLDGATRMQTFWKIIFPMLLPAVGSAIILSMQYSWNELVYSLQLTSMDSYTLPVGIGRFVGAVSVDWGKSSAAASITMVPIILVGFFMQKYLVSGLTAGAVKE